MSPYFYSTPPLHQYIFMAWYNRDNFTFTFTLHSITHIKQVKL
jgi:hypothetical protein